MPSVKTEKEVFRLKFRRIPSAIWGRDFQYIRNLCRAMLKRLRKVFSGLEKPGEAVAPDSVYTRIFGERETMSDSLVKIGTLLLRWHEQDMRRQNPDAPREAPPPLGERDFALIERALARHRNQASEEE